MPLYSALFKCLFRGAVGLKFHWAVAPLIPLAEISGWWVRRLPAEIRGSVAQVEMMSHFPKQFLTSCSEVVCMCQPHAHFSRIAWLQLTLRYVCFEMPVQNEQELAKQVIFFVIRLCRGTYLRASIFLYITWAKMTAHFISFILGL